MKAIAEISATWQQGQINGLLMYYVQYTRDRTAHRQEIQKCGLSEVHKYIDFSQVLLEFTASYKK
jgi:hypothetical protein